MAIRIKQSVALLASAFGLSVVLSANAADSSATRAPTARDAAPAAAPAAVKSNVDHVRMSSLIGQNLRNTRGENVGEIEDLVIDTQSGKVHYAVVGFGGFLGLGEKLFAFPMDAFKVVDERSMDRRVSAMENDGMRGDRGAIGSERAAATGERRGVTPLDNDAARGDKGAIGSDRVAAGGERRGVTPLDNDGVRGDKGPIGTDRVAAAEARRDGDRAATGTRQRTGLEGMQLVLDVDKDKLKDAPGFDKKNWPDWNDANVRGPIDRFHNRAERAPAGDVKAGAGMRMARASQLLDAEIKDAQGAEIGEINDIVVNVKTGEVRFAVVEFDRKWSMNDKLVTVPMKAFSRGSDRDGFVFTGDRAQLERAPAFAKNQWPDLNSGTFRSDVDRFVSGWGGQPATDRAATAGRSSTPAAGAPAAGGPAGTPAGGESYGTKKDAPATK